MCTCVALSWHLRARRRAPDSERHRLFVRGLDASQRTSDEVCNAPDDLGAEFQVSRIADAFESTRLLTRRGFQEAARRASRPDVCCSDEQRLQLYALFKQATVGACAAPPPSRLDFIAHAKWYELRRRACAGP